MFLSILIILFVLCAIAVCYMLLHNSNMNYEFLHCEIRDLTYDIKNFWHDTSNLLFSSGGGENPNTEEPTNGYKTSPELTPSLLDLEPDKVTERINDSHIREETGTLTGEHNTSGHRYAKNSAEASNFKVQNCLECFQAESLGRRGAEEHIHSTCGHLENNTISCHYCMKKDNPRVT